MSQLQSLRQYTTVVADTGDFERIKDLQPTDATTNPSLILKAIQQEKYRHLLNEVLVAYPNADIDETIDHLLVKFGTHILAVVPGRVSTEIDASLSFDTQATVQRARQIIRYYQEAGVDTSRVLIKIASTWEGIQAAKILEEEGIRCNLTLLFSLTQAIACADAKVQLISPFVGRIYDWYKKMAGDKWDEEASRGVNDPGVKSVTSIYHYYKKAGITTEIMGASFRNTDQILALAGCDLLTISPELLNALNEQEGDVAPQLRPDNVGDVEILSAPLSEPAFRFALNQDAMSSEKLAEGIRAFVADTDILKRMIQEAKSR